MSKSRLIIFILVALFGGTAAAYAAAHKQASSKTSGAIAVANNSVLLGNTTLGSTSDSNTSNDGQAWVYTATQSGTVSDVQTYITSGDAATWLTVGLYSTSASKPSTLVAAGSARVKKGAWNDITIGSTKVVAGTKYAVAILGTGGAVGFRDTVSGACSTWTSSSASLKALPAKWSTGGTFSGYCPASIYVNGTNGTTTSTTTTSTSTTPTSTTSTTPTTTTPTTTTPTTTTTTSTTTTTPPPPPGGAIVGVAADPKVACGTTITSSGGLDAALASAPAGSVVCLKAGTSFGDISFDTASTKAITVDGQGDTVGGVSVDQRISNLTLQGMSSQGFYILDPASNITIQYDTVSHVAAGEGVLISSTSHGQTGAITQTTVRYNQFDHLGECLGDTGDQSSTTFSHNVCGPGLGYGDTASTDPGHYIQTGGENNMTVTNNAFIGPDDPAAAKVGLHLNVFHDWGNTNGLNFSNNLLWHDNAIGQAMLLQTGQFQNVSVKNNVAVEQPNDSVEAYTFWVDTAHTLAFSNNTTVNSAYGNLVTVAQTSQDYSSDTNASAANNLTDATWDNADCNYAGDVTQSNNYSGDTSCSLRFNGQWQNTSYTPGLPYSPPPAGWYQPQALPGVGYQGSVGP